MVYARMRGRARSKYSVAPSVTHITHRVRLMWYGGQGTYWRSSVRRPARVWGSVSLWPVAGNLEGNLAGKSKHKVAG